MGLSRGFGSRWGLSGVNLRLHAGRSLLIAGHNGAGKTTLLRLLATTLRPTAGSVHLGGIDSGKDPLGARRQVAMLGHRTGLYPELTALENLTVAARLMGLEDHERRALELLDRVGLAGRARDPVREFSAGMKKRCALARVLLQDPAVVLLDEPYGQLDPSGFDLIDRFLRDCAAQGRALIVATHLVERAAALLDTGLVLASGRPVWVGPARELPPALTAALAL
ncbi:MAG: heme ABC exporter ATP-binding protein CcmA [Deltaproteobacteria bacterium]|nr:heme ABC exporter ATP-binding protein CcmA [Deltaproteobacteria bacterium]MCB9785457.1 heme ABC exporter ATP-binding protein CcmA [Deltaproteobacteria bacterium]